MNVFPMEKNISVPNKPSPLSSSDDMSLEQEDSSSKSNKLASSSRYRRHTTSSSRLQKSVSLSSIRPGGVILEAEDEPLKSDKLSTLSSSGKLKKSATQRSMSLCLSLVKRSDGTLVGRENSLSKSNNEASSKYRRHNTVSSTLQKAVSLSSVRSDGVILEDEDESLKSNKLSTLSSSGKRIRGARFQRSTSLHALDLAKYPASRNQKIPQSRKNLPQRELLRSSSYNSPRFLPSTSSHVPPRLSPRIISRNSSCVSPRTKSLLSPRVSLESSPEPSPRRGRGKSYKIVIDDALNLTLNDEEKPSYDTIFDCIKELGEVYTYLGQTAMHSSNDSPRLMARCVENQRLLMDCHKRLCQYWATMILKENEHDPEEVRSCIDGLDAVEGLLAIPIDDAWNEKEDNEERVLNAEQGCAKRKEMAKVFTEQASYWQKRSKKIVKQRAAAVTVKDEGNSDYDVLISQLKKTQREKKWENKIAVAREQEMSVSKNAAQRKKDILIQQMQPLIMQYKEINEKLYCNAVSKNPNNNGAPEQAIVLKAHEYYYDEVWRELQKSLGDFSPVEKRAPCAEEDRVQQEFSELLFKLEVNAALICFLICQQIRIDEELNNNRSDYITSVKKDIQKNLDQHNTFIKEWEEFIILRARIKLLLSKEYPLNPQERKLVDAHIN